MSRQATIGTRGTSTEQGGCCCCGPGSCDTLQCLCRPRFFAGQLLTEQDLQRLDQYIVAKDRLHNRHLHGTGVVCGLEVVCNPCDDTVTVRAGYALGPCGEDIVVCQDTRVDVGDLIRQQRQAQAKVDDCRPFGDRPTDDCEEARQPWVLAICYDERPSRGVTSLRPPSTCSSGCIGVCTCGGGGGAGSGCSCGSGSSGSMGASSSSACSCGTTRTRPQPAQCEPTLTCEGYRFVVRKLAPRVSMGTGRDVLSSASGGLSAAAGLAGSELGDRVNSCMLNLVARITALPKDPEPEALVVFCCELKADLRDIIDTGNVHDCLIGARLSDIVCPDTSDPAVQVKAVAAITALLQVAIDLFRDCLCSALLPPCPTDSPDDCVPLATLTVRTADLRVLDICNWSSRRFAVTMPMLGYWLGWLPMFDTIRAAVTKLCCPPAKERPAFDLDQKLRVRAVAAAVSDQQPGAAAAKKAGAAAAKKAGAAAAKKAAADAAAVPPKDLPTGRGSTVSTLAEQYARHTTPLTGLEATFLGALGALDLEDAPLASDVELADPLAALSLSRFGAPAGAAVVPERITAVLGSILRQGDDQPRAVPVDPDRIARLEDELASLRELVETQAAAITRMRRPRKAT